MKRFVRLVLEDKILVLVLTDTLLLVVPVICAEHVGSKQALLPLLNRLHVQDSFSQRFNKKKRNGHDAGDTAGDLPNSFNCFQHSDTPLPYTRSVAVRNGTVPCTAHIAPHDTASVACYLRRTRCRSSRSRRARAK